MRLLIDDERCTGHGRCYTLVPALFDVDDLGRGIVRASGSLDTAQLDQARTAMRSCPEQAISLVAH